MGVNDKDILDFLHSKENGTCQLGELLESLKCKPDFAQDRVLHDIENLEKDKLLTYDQVTETLILLPKANRPVVPMPPNVRK